MYITDKKKKKKNQTLYAGVDGTSKTITIVDLEFGRYYDCDSQCWSTILKSFNYERSFVTLTHGQFSC